MSSVISDDEKVKKSAADEVVVVEDIAESPTEMDLDEPELNLKLSEDEEEEEDDGDDTDIDDDLLNSFTSVLTTPESPVKRLVIGKSSSSQNILLHTYGLYTTYLILQAENPLIYIVLYCLPILYVIGQFHCLFVEFSNNSKAYFIENSQRF